MDRFSQRLDQARQARESLISKRSGSTSEIEWNEDLLTKAIEAGLNPEQWTERAALFEYNAFDFSIVDTYSLDSANDRSVANKLRLSLIDIKSNKNMYLRVDQPSFVRTGKEGGSENILIGKIDNKFCLVADSSSSAIISPLFDSLLNVTDEYIDVQHENYRIRIANGDYELSNFQTSDNRRWDLNNAGNLPQCLSLYKSIKLSLLEPDQSVLATIEPQTKTSEVVVEYPDNEAHLSFESILDTVVRYIKSQRVSSELVTQLRNTDKALHLPSAQLDNQMYTLSVRTSENADVLFFHNTTSIKSNQDQVADVLSQMTTDEYLELALDDNRRQQLIADTLIETGFYFMRQHNGQILIMDRSTASSSIITPASPIFMSVLNRAESKIAEYFAALENQTTGSVPLRVTRMNLADEIEELIPIKDRSDISRGNKIAYWLLNFKW